MATAENTKCNPKAVFERIPDSAENIVKTVLITPPDKEWKYLKRKAAK